MGTFSDILLGPGDGASLYPAQDQTLRSGHKPEELAAATQIQTTPAMPSFSDQLLGGQPTIGATRPDIDPFAEPDAPSWLGRRWQDIRGRQDARFKNLPAFDGGGVDPTTLEQAKLLGPDDEGLANIIKSNLGDKFVGIKKDANGYPIITYKGEDGKELSAYINRPGLDVADVDRGISAAIPYAAAATGAGRLLKGLGTGGQILTQALTAGGTSLAADAGSIAMGSEQGIDPVKAGVAMVAGGAGQALAVPIDAFVRKFIVVPSLFDRSSQKLTEKGAEVARRLGIDPEDLTGRIGQEFAKAYAKTRSGAQAQAAAQTDAQFGIPTTLGQRSKDPQALMNEKNMRYGVYGDAAKQTMTDFDKAQARAIQEAALGGMRPIPGSSAVQAYEATGVAPMLAPRRPFGGGGHPEDLGVGIQEGLRDARNAARASEAEAWQSVTDITPKPEAFALLPNAIGSRLGSLRVDDRLTPKAYAMAMDLDGYVSGKALTEGGPAVLGQAPVRTLDEMRRRLLATYKGASDATDRAAAKAIYSGFNDWLEEAAGKALVNGDVKAAAQMRVARDITKEIKAVFEPTGSDGRRTAGGALLDRVLKADSGEGIVATLFGLNPATSQPKQGAIQALAVIKKAFDTYLPKDAAQAAWADVKLANWLRLVQDKRGEVFSPQVMLNNLKGAFANQPTLMRALYTPEELKVMRQFAGAVSRVAYKDPNPSGTASGVGVMGRELGQTLLAALGYQNGALSKMVQMLLGGTGIKNATGAVAARSATSQTIKPTVPATGGLAAGVTEAPTTPWH